MRINKEENKMEILKVNSENFEEEVLNSKNTVLVDFYADWCGPCKMLAPVLEGLSEKMDKVTFYKVNVDASSDLAGRYGIQAIPNLVIFKDNKVLISDKTKTVFKDLLFLKDNHIELPEIIQFKEEALLYGIKLQNTKSVNDLIKDVYKNVKENKKEV